MLAKDGKKSCGKCKIIKDISEYHKHSKNKDGLRENCKECCKLYRKQYIENNREKVLKSKKDYRLNNKESIRIAKRKSNKTYRDKNKFKILISHGVKKALEVSTRSRIIFEALGYTIEDLKCHLESKFSEGMSWDNYGKWHIDHIIPQSWLPFETLEDENFKKCWSLCNLQPLWAKDNCSKGNRYAG